MASIPAIFLYSHYSYLGSRASSGFGLAAWQWFLMIGAFAVTAFASVYMKSTFSKYTKVFSSSGMTGAQAAESILYSQGITGMPIYPINGELTDHYDPSQKSLSLSSSSYNRISVAAIAVAAHECGHAVQDAQGFGPLKLRSSLVPITNLASQLSWPIVLFGIIFSLPSLARFGVYLFAAVVIFQLVTLPVEFDASRRGMAMLRDLNILNAEELGMSRKVLTAAALTYVAALASSIMTLIRLLMMTQKRRD